MDQKTSQCLVRLPFASCIATHLLRIELIRRLIVECCLTIQWLHEVAGYRRELEHTVVHIDPEHPKHAQWVTGQVSLHAMKELGQFPLLGIVYRSLLHGAMHYHSGAWM